MLPHVALLVAAACASAEMYKDDSPRFTRRNDRRVREIGSPSLPHGCLYEGRWFTEGSVVTTREACLRCVCARGALSCRRRACAALPDPPPHRCHVLHRKGACCPELHCPDGVKIMEHGASARFESDDIADIATPASPFHACVEGGTVYSAGSAMESHTACEQCFCLGGARRCVRPRCLPPPAGCRARPASGACCPQRYYCDHISTKPPEQRHLHDCEVKDRWISEGERVISAESRGNCTRCFCLRGSVHCQPLACAPPLLGCEPLLRPGQCCPHQYHCDHKQQGYLTSHLPLMSDNVLISTRSNDRSFSPSKLNEVEITTKTTSTTLVSSTVKNQQSTPTTLETKTSTIPTTKVKRKTNDQPPTDIKLKTKEKITSSATTQKPSTTTAETPHTTTTEKASTEESTETMSTEQPDGTVKIVINGTINCTAELSSASLPLNLTTNETEEIKLDARTPVINDIDIEAQTSYPNDIITDRNVSGDFDENEMFVINVTSSLRTNTSHSTATPVVANFSKVTIPEDVVDTTNNSKKTKGDYDYDYTEPTLPPSLPNLKIIPFVAADAVVDEDIPSKEPLAYPILEREDKYPVYYPTMESKETPYATRREDKYSPTQYPVFVSERDEAAQYHPSAQDENLSSGAYLSSHNDLITSLQGYSVPTSIGNYNPDVKIIKKVTSKPSTTTKFTIKTPSVNLFSPPVETEGGFIPKGPGIIDEYYAVYPSTPPGPPIPHLTTSMQLDISKGECITGDGRHIPEGDTLSFACSVCTCAWGEVHCSPRPCHTPSGCRRKPASNNAADLCCGELVCDKDSSTTSQLLSSTTEKINPSTNKSVENKTKSNTTHEIENKNTQIFSNNSVHSNATTFNYTVEENEQKKDNESINETSTATSLEKISTISLTTITTTTTTIAPASKKSNETNNHSQEYEEEEEDDDGFFFGNVLKLILSDNYDTTIAPYKRKTTTIARHPDSTKPPSTTTTTTKKPTLKPTIAPFIPMPHHQIPYVPPQKNFLPNTVNRIDHLVLGEATAIKKTTPRPLTTPFKIKPSSFKPLPPSRSTTQRPIFTTRFTETTKKEQPSVQRTPGSHEGSRPPAPSGLPGLGSGLLKLAGCNIYGRMYRVGRIIAELSTPCQECWCTEIGVQCKQLNC